MHHPRCRRMRRLRRLGRRSASPSVCARTCIEGWSGHFAIRWRAGQAVPVRSQQSSLSLLCRTHADCPAPMRCLLQSVLRLAKGNSQYLLLRVLLLLLLLSMPRGRQSRYARRRCLAGRGSLPKRTWRAGLRCANLHSSAQSPAASNIGCARSAVAFLGEGGAHVPACWPVCHRRCGPQQQ